MEKIISYRRKTIVRGKHSGGTGHVNETYYSGEFTEPKDFIFRTERGVVNVRIDPTKGEISADAPLKGGECHHKGRGFQLDPVKGSERFSRTMKGASDRIEFLSHRPNSVFDLLSYLNSEKESLDLRTPDSRHLEYLFFERSVKRYVGVFGREIGLPTVNDIYHSVSRALDRGIAQVFYGLHRLGRK